MSIIVFGSINMDLVAQVPRLPKPAETLTGTGFFTTPGGKGANQAVAAARLGALTFMVGRVGNDEFGAVLRKHLEDEGVRTDGIITDPEFSSGVAQIAVEESGQNHIIVVPGANGNLSESDLERLEDMLPRAKILLMQLEIPLNITLQATRLARRHNVQVVLDPAPVIDLPGEIYPLIDIITPNEIEAAHLVGYLVNDLENAFRAADDLLSLGARAAIVKLGAAGVVFASQDLDIRGFVEPFAVTSVDSVAAGDAFNGGLAVSLSEGLNLPDAVRFGAAAGALATTKRGAQTAMPRRDEVHQFLSNQPQTEK
jgi:ribokinase